MRMAFGALALLVACSDDGNMLPIGGGNSDGGNNLIDGSRPIDARLIDAKLVDAPPALVDANLFSGRVCLIADPRMLDVCASTGADGLTVRLGTAVATTSADGSFVIVGQSGQGLVWRITGANIMSSYEQLADYQIPAIPKTLFQSMMTANNVMQVSGEGSLMIRVVNNGTGAVGATASAALPNVPYYTPFYDGSTATVWQQTATQANGAVWMAGLDVGTANITAGYSGKTITDPNQPIFDDGITFTTIIFP